MSEIEELLARSRALLATTPSKKQKGPKRLPGNEIRFLRRTHWYPPKKSHDFQRLSVYFPTAIPDIDSTLSIVELHYHEPFEACHYKYWCHEVGFEPSQFERESFMVIWSYLYEKPLEIEGSSFNFQL